MTLVVIEHDIPMVMRLSDRILAMESGLLIADGTRREVRADPLVIESYLGGDVTAIERSGVLTKAKAAKRTSPKRTKKAARSRA